MTLDGVVFQFCGDEGFASPVEYPTTNYTQLSFPKTPTDEPTFEIAAVMPFPPEEVKLQSETISHDKLEKIQGKHYTIDIRLGRNTTNRFYEFFEQFIGANFKRVVFTNGATTTTLDVVLRDNTESEYLDNLDVSKDYTFHFSTRLIQAATFQLGF